MQNYVIELNAESSGSFRCQKAADSLDIDISKKLTHRLEIKNISIPDIYQVGMIIGASGSGKTTLAKDLFNFQDVVECDYEIPIIDQLPEEYSYSECAELLSGVGLSSVPCWIKPLKLLSNGQKARAIIALEFSKKNEVKIIDEWTSVVDRNAAKSMSLGVKKYINKKNIKAILISCHYDIIEWVQPDWIIDCNEQTFYLYGKKKEKINLSLKLNGCQMERVGSSLTNIII